MVEGGGTEAATETPPGTKAFAVTFRDVFKVVDCTWGLGFKLEVIVGAGAVC
jgi:hypothetical protein